MKQNKTICLDPKAIKQGEKQKKKDESFSAYVERLILNDK